MGNKTSSGLKPSKQSSWIQGKQTTWSTMLERYTKTKIRWPSNKRTHIILESAKQISRAVQH